MRGILEVIVVGFLTGSIVIFIGSFAGIESVVGSLSSREATIMSGSIVWRSAVLLVLLRIWAAVDRE